MAQSPNTVEVHILDKEYLVTCPPESRDSLVRAAIHLDTKMREIRGSGKLFGAERIAVMAALNITHEFLSQGASASAVNDTLTSMSTRIDEALSRHK